MWLLPSLSRPERLQAFFDSYQQAGETAAVRVVLASWDPRLREYDKVAMPQNARVAVTDVKYVCPTFNWAFNQWPGEKCYGLINDDVLIRTPKALTLLEQEAGDRWISAPYDGHHSSFYTFPCVGGELARAVGLLTPDTLRHNGGEGLWNDLGNHFRILRPRPDIYIEHLHVLFGKSDDDFTYQLGREGSEGTPDRYRDFMNRNYAGILERVGKLYG